MRPQGADWAQRPCRTVRRLFLAAVALLIGGLFGAGPEQAMAAAPILQLDTGGPMGLVRSLVVTRGGTQLISASDDKVVRVWDLGTGRTVRTIRGEIGDGDAGKIYALALSPDGRLLAVGGRTGAREGADHPIRLYDLANGEIVGLLNGHRDGVLSLDFSPDGRLLVSGSVDDTAIVWDVASRRGLHRLSGHQSDVNAVRFTRDGAEVATAGDDHAVRLWRVSDGTQMALMRDHTDQVLALAVSPRTGAIASGALDATIRLWEPHGGRASRTLARQRSEVMSLAFSPDGARLLSGSGSTPFEANVWDAASGALLATYGGHDNLVLSAVFSPDGGTAITGGGDNNEIHVWNAGDGQRRQILAGEGRPVWSIGFSKDGRSIAWGSERSGGEPNQQGALAFALRLPAADRQMGEPHPVAPNDQGFVRAITSGGRLSLNHRAGGTFGYYADLDVIADGKVVATIERDETNGYAHNAYSFTPDGRTIITGGGHGWLTAYDTRGRRLGEFVGHTSDVWAIAVSPDGRFLLSGSDDQTVRLWNIATRENIITLLHGRSGEWVAWTPRGYYAASPSGDRHVGWQINEGAERAARFVAAAQLKRHFYRPDIVTRALVLGSSSRAENETGAAPFSLAELSDRRPPEVRLASPQGAQADQSPLALRVAVTANADPVVGFDVTVNGRRILSQVPPSAALAKGNAGEQTFLVPLAAGENEIEVAALNAVGRTIETLNIRHSGRDDPDKRGSLYVVAVGVDDYPHFGQNLRFAGADARAFNRLLVARAGPLYEHVESLVLAKQADAEPTAANVNAALKLLRKTGPDDTVVVFLAGHGVNEGADYLFLPSDARLKASKFDRGSVIPWQRLQETLESTRGRRIMLVDTCKSGNAFNARLVKDAADAKVVVFAATDADTLAQERAVLGHGVFTYAVLEGLKGGADLLPDRLVKVQELSAFVDRLVRSLTDGRQQPTFHSSGAADYVLTRF